MKKNTARKTAARKSNVKKSNNRKNKVQKRVSVQNELDSNYIFIAKKSAVKNHTLLKTDYDHSFFSNYASTDYIRNNMNCTNFTSYSSKKNNCLICQVSDFCKLTKISNDNSFSAVHIEQRAKRTECKDSMINEIILALYNDSSTAARKALIIAMSAKYNKRNNAVKSKVQSYACCIKHLTKSNKATTEDKLVKRYCSYLMKQFKIKNFVLTSSDKSSTSYCVKAYNVLTDAKLI